jgi:uncharacterized protein YndB with AHSA1/START domain
MAFQEKPGHINWKVHFSSPMEKVFDALTTDKGRKTFWAEKTVEKDEFVEFHFINYPKYTSRILISNPPKSFKLEYFDTEVGFSLHETEDGGTDLHLNALTHDEELRHEMTSGWVSVLLTMKAAVDFGVDLRNHSSERAWDNGYVDN